MSKNYTLQFPAKESSIFSFNTRDMRNLITAIALIFTVSASAQNAEKVYPPVLEGCEQMESFEDCQNCFFRHLMTEVMQELKWPAALESEGKVFVEIVYNTESELENITVKKSFSPLASAEVERVLKALKTPKSPAIQGDKPVKVSYVLPVSFQK